MLSIKKNKEKLLEIISKCDPMLMDTACQIRASRLLNYYHLIHATPENPISEADEERCIRYVLMCEMLTNYGASESRQNIDLYQLDPTIRPEIPNSGYKLNLKLDKRSIKTGSLYLFIEDEHLHYTVRPGESEVENTASFTEKELKILGIESLPSKLTPKLIETHLTPKLVDILKITTKRGHTPISNAEKENFIAKAVEKIAQESIDFLKEKAPSLNAIAKYFEKDYLFITKGKNRHVTYINLLPCFISTHLMLHDLKTTHALLIINLKRKGLTEDKTIRIHYRYNVLDERFNALGAKEISPDDEGALEIDMNSCISYRKDPNIETFFSEPDFKSFVNKFKAFDIAKIILMGAAGHAQHPADAKGNGKPEGADMEDFPREDVVREPGSLKGIDVTLEKFSREQYTALYAAAKHYDLVKKVEKKEEDIPAAARIKHIHVAKSHEHVINRPAFERFRFFAAMQPATVQPVQTALEAVKETNQLS